MIFPDSGASICIAGPKHIQSLGLTLKDLIPCYKEIRAVGGSILTCLEWIPLKFNITPYQTTQPVYICDKVDRIYLSKTGCIDVHIIPSTFPYPMNPSEPQPSISAIDVPSRPTSLPYPATDEN